MRRAPPDHFSCRLPRVRRRQEKGALKALNARGPWRTCLQGPLRATEAPRLLRGGESYREPSVASRNALLGEPIVVLIILVVVVGGAVVVVFGCVVAICLISPAPRLPASRPVPLSSACHRATRGVSWWKTS